VSVLAVLLVLVVLAQSFAVTAVPMALITPAVSAGSSVPTEVNNDNITNATVIKLWTVTHSPVSGTLTYMAKFIGDEYVVVFTGHGDVSLDGSYVSVWENGKAFLYEVKTGKLIRTFTGPGVFDLWTGAKVWDRSGFFSGDSAVLIEDVYKYGTNARIVYVGSWTAVPIDWGFTDTTSGHFYAAQLDYYGTTLAVGHICEHRLIVYMGAPYEPVFTYTDNEYYSEYGRRLQMTLDGDIILVGGRYYPYLDIWKLVPEEHTYIRVVHYWLPGGVDDSIGALGISDPWNVGYVIIGTMNGWVIIAHYNRTTDEFKVLYKNKEAGDGAWFYNPFYDRWIPRVTEVFALMSKGGVGIIYDVVTNTSHKFLFGGDYGSRKAAAVSPSGTYVFLGDSLYMVLKRDTLAGIPQNQVLGQVALPRPHEGSGFSRGGGASEQGLAHAVPQREAYGEEALRRAGAGATNRGSRLP